MPSFCYVRLPECNPFLLESQLFGGKLAVSFQGGEVNGLPVVG